MRMDRRTWLAAMAAGLTGEIGSSILHGQSGRSPVDAVQDAERAFADTMARRDHSAFTSYLADDAIFFSSPDGLEVLRGKSAIAAGWARYFDGPRAPFSWAPNTAQVLDSGHLAMTTGPVRNPDGAVVGRFNSVWRLEPNGFWRVVFDRGCSCA